MNKKSGDVTVALNAYSDLLVRTICNMIYLDPAQNKRRLIPKFKLYRQIVDETDETREKRMESRINGADWPSCAHSMAGYKRLRNLADCMLEVLKNDIPGDFIETGVWRGGACILMRGLSKAANQEKRKTYVADSFEGLPPPNAEEYPADKGDTLYTRSDMLGITLESVQDNFRSYDLLDDNVVFMKGWFKDTLPQLKAKKFAIIRLDGDMYESTIQAIEELYPKLAVGGYIIVDDFGAVRGCKKAINDYRESHGITDPIEKVDWTGVYWKKSGEISKG